MYGRGFGMGRGMGMGNPYPFCRFFPWLPRRWWAYGMTPYAPGPMPYPGYTPRMAPPGVAYPPPSVYAWPWRMPYAPSW